MRQSTDQFMDKLLEENVGKSSNVAASAAEKIGQKMEKAVKELTQKYEDKEPDTVSEPDEPEQANETNEPEQADETNEPEENNED